ncbi:hypothetical protein IRJ41_013991 [Triplophysa rosa]|uniref:Uncharacterized protein n=1 Tax=Triplophysa rosa TaxID=992332 RepID=A0A9W8C5L6_TRIRA|nr:hypothetical protein IRJ41_013991 [Triplophysa rosa]
MQLVQAFASGVSLRASAPHRADGNTNTSKSWQADTNEQLYRTDYLVTDHLADEN